jgi:hypothetical protein
VTARSETFTEHGERPLTVNALVNMHRQVWAKHTAEVRKFWAELAEGTPPMVAMAVEATPLHRDRRSPQDVAACAPHVKAAIDGMVDAGVIPDDDAAHLVAVTFRPPEVCGHNGIRITITEAPATAST